MPAISLKLICPDNEEIVAELTGAFALVFCGTGAIIINQEASGIIGHAGIAATFGLIFKVILYT